MLWCISSVQLWGQTTGIRQQKSNTKLPVALTQPASEQPACDWCRHKIQVSKMKGCLVNSSEGSGMVSTLNCSAPWLWLQTEELLMLCQDLNEGSDTIPSDATSKSRVLLHWKIQSQPASDGFYPHKVKKVTDIIYNSKKHWNSWKENHIKQFAIFIRYIRYVCMYVFMYLLMPGFVATPVLKLKQIKFIFLSKYGKIWFIAY